MSHLQEWNMLTCYETLKNSQAMQDSLLREYGTAFTMKIVSSKLYSVFVTWWCADYLT